MKSLTPLFCAACLLLAAPAAFAQHAHHAAEPAKSSSASTGKTSYPLDTCVVSGEELGSMGEPFDYIHKETGKPDRLVRMCCDGCLKKFKKDPAKYLARIDAAQAEKSGKKS
jgi:hypothetical protein